MNFSFTSRKRLYCFSDLQDADPSGILFLDTSSKVEYCHSSSFLQESHTLKLFVAISCSLENKKCFSSREYVLSFANEQEAVEWQSSIERAIQVPILKVTETTLKGDSPKRATEELGNMVISQPVLISKKTFAMSKSAASSYFTHRRNSVSDDLTASKSLPFVPENAASYHPGSCLSTSQASNFSSITRNTSVSSHHERSFSSRFRGSISGMLLPENQDGKYSLNILICKSIADSIRSFLGILGKIEHEVENANAKTDYYGFVEFLSAEETAEFFTLMFNNCEQINEELNDIESELVSPSSFHSLDCSAKDLINSVGTFISTMKNSIHLDNPDKDCFVKLLMVIDSLSDCCRQILVAVNEIVKHQCTYLSAKSVSAMSQSQQSLDTIPATPISNTEEDDRKVVQSVIDMETRQSDSSPDIVFKDTEEADGSMIVKGGALEALVERLTYHCKPDARFMYIFLLTYRSFTTANELLCLLFQRYNCKCSEDLTEKQYEIYKSKKLIPIRLRVLNVLKSWVKTNFEDFQKEPELLVTLQKFLPVMRGDFRKGTEDFEVLINKLKNNESPLALTALKLPKPPAPIVPKKVESILDLDPLEIARQMTLMEWKWFSAIKPEECLDQAWNTKELQHRSPNILSLIKHLNFIVYWIGTELTSHPNIKNRAAVLKHFLQVAEKCRQLNNYNAVMAILAGLNTTAVTRMKKTWEMLPSKCKSTYDGLNELMSESKGFKNYKQELAITEPPCIPFLGVYLTNLVFIETGNKDFLSDNKKHINFDKRHKIAKVIEELSSYQRSTYNLSEVPAIRSYILDQVVKKEEDIYNLSLELEPRESSNK